MQLRKGYEVSHTRVGTCLFVLLTLTGSAVTSQTRQALLSKINNKRLDDVTAQNVTTRSATACGVRCLLTSGCVSVNLSPDRRTCQLLSGEVSDEVSLQSADGWSHMRKIQTKTNVAFCRATC